MLKQRREFLKFMGKFYAGMQLVPLIVPAGCATTTSKNLPFTPLSPDTTDELSLAKGFNYKLLISAEQTINPSEKFGHNNDYLAFIPFKGSKDHGLLWVNHEYLYPTLVHRRKIEGERSKSEILAEKKSVGGSILEVKQNKGQWEIVQNSKYNRRLDATTVIPFEKGYKILNKSEAVGTLANCAGGVTPWGTILTCEENYDIFYGDVDYKNGVREVKTKKHHAINWHKYKGEAQPPEHFGWVVEVDLKTGKAIKRVALGRAPHECATVVLSTSGYPVVYMGEDKVGGFVFKFVSSHKNNLSSGKLYAANTETGQWLELNRDKHEILQKNFKDQTEVLIFSHKAANLLGATPQDRPEDVEIHPFTKDVYISMTKNPRTNNYSGSIMKIAEGNGAHESETFKATTWLNGGIENGFVCPDNIAFDKKGNMWLTVDMSSKAIKKGKYPGIGNNGLYYIAMSGPHAGQPLQIASAPVDAELTGPYFSPDQKTLFLSVQHPGSSTKDPINPTSHWPTGQLPLSSVVTIQGPALEALTLG